MEEKISLPEYRDNSWSYLLLGMSIGLFYLTRWILNKCFVGNHVGLISSNTNQGEHNLQNRTNYRTKWKWVNTANSLFHSFVTGIGACICFYLYPETAVDVVNTYSVLSHGLTAFSVGYFVFDFFDMFLNHRKTSTYELMIHHSFVITCFTVGLETGNYLGFVMVALVIEVNSIFLHWRQLLILSQVPKHSTYYRTISLLNLFTFVLFRIVTLGWMTRWLALNEEKVVIGWVYTLGCVAMAVLVCMSSVLFWRLLRVDLFFNASSGSSSKSQQSKCSKGVEHVQGDTESATGCNDCDSKVKVH